MDKKLQALNYGVVGLGIMGGSFAKAIRQRILSVPDATGKIFACNRSPAPLSQSIEEGVVDEIYPLNDAASMLNKCDVVFVCLYPRLTIDFLISHKDDFKSGAIITDISGVKSIYIPRLGELARPDTDFIIGHPMAGGEKEGYTFSNANFFIDHNYILVPTQNNKQENIRFFEDIIAALGFSRITCTDCHTHDDKIGFTSQLCHVIASALVDSATDDNITAFGGGSFEDLTRIAMINAPLWTELFLANKSVLLDHISQFEKSLDKIKSAIEQEDSNTLVSTLQDVRTKRIRMGSVRSKVVS